jgi:hypothetical protein
MEASHWPDYPLIINLIYFLEVKISLFQVNKKYTKFQRAETCNLVFPREA